LRKQYEIADKQVLSKIRALFGGRIKNCVTGAAPINPEILRFFDAAGVLVLEGWGMTETSTAATVARPDAFKIGKVGKAFNGCEIRIADDGEILVRGPNVFQGYYKNEEATRETLEDGWLHTGDIGELDDDGYLSITVARRTSSSPRAARTSPRQPRGRDQAEPVLSPVRGDRGRSLPGRADHADMEECAKLARRRVG
jgi:long-chain acyl-CoA synthetase